MDDRIKGMLGLAMRAGCITDGTERALNEVRKKNSSLILLDTASSANTQKQVKDKCAFYGSTVIMVPAGLLDAALGKSGRMVAAVKKGGFDTRLRELIEQDGSSAK